MKNSIVNSSSLGIIDIVKSSVTIPVTMSQSNEFRKRLTHSGWNQFVGGDETTQSPSWTVRRRILSALRKSCRVMGPGQKSRIGRLGGGAAIGAKIGRAHV